MGLLGDGGGAPGFLVPVVSYAPLLMIKGKRSVADALTIFRYLEKC